MLTTLFHADGRTCHAMESQIAAMEAKGFSRTPPKAQKSEATEAPAVGEMSVKQLRDAIKKAGIEIPAVHDRAWLEAAFQALPPKE